MTLFDFIKHCYVNYEINVKVVTVWDSGMTISFGGYDGSDLGHVSTYNNVGNVKPTGTYQAPVRNLLVDIRETSEHKVIEQLIIVLDELLKCNAANNVINLGETRR